jgi:hypothetical protein
VSADRGFQRAATDPKKAPTAVGFWRRLGSDPEEQQQPVGRLPEKGRPRLLVAVAYLVFRVSSGSARCGRRALLTTFLPAREIQMFQMLKYLAPAVLCLTVEGMAEACGPCPSSGYGASPGAVQVVNVNISRPSNQPSNNNLNNNLNNNRNANRNALNTTGARQGVNVSNNGTNNNSRNTRTVNGANNATNKVGSNTVNNSKVGNNTANKTTANARLGANNSRNQMPSNGSTSRAVNSTNGSNK